jgi:hypothetical protein
MPPPEGTLRQAWSKLFTEPKEAATSPASGPPLPTLPQPPVNNPLEAVATTAGGTVFQVAKVGVTHTLPNLAPVSASIVQTVAVDLVAGTATSEYLWRWLRTRYQW